jgi:outer membrane protein W
MSADLKFSGEGGKNTFDAGGNHQEWKYRAYYIRVPIQAVYFFGDLGDVVRPKISLGPSAGFLVAGDSKAYINDALDSKLKTKDLLEGFDFGLTGAVGVNFKLGGDKWLNTDISYYHGITDAGIFIELRNRNVMLNIGLLFPIGTVTPENKK